MGPKDTGPETPKENIHDQLQDLWSIIVEPEAKGALGALAAAITFIIALNAIAQIRLNDWQGNIYDAIGQRDVSIFLHQSMVFVIIVSVLLCLGVAQTWLHEMLKVRFRQAVTYDLLDEWLRPRRIYQLRQSGEISVNPDQRVQDDARRLSELSIDLAVGLVQSTFLLIAFIGVLWQLSSGVVFSISGKHVVIPGYMVWAAVVYSAMGSLFTWIVGRPLIRAHTELRAKEADFRFALVRVSESADEIALFGGEAEERGYLDTPVNSLLFTMRHIANRLAGLTWVTGGYGWIAILVPLLLAAPGYFGGTLTLGGLMMVVGAFYQVGSALRWFVDKFPAIAEWRAMLARITLYREALQRLPLLDGQSQEIGYESGAPEISIENLCIFAPNGNISLNELHLKVEPGERVLIEAAPKSGKSMFLKALAGLWIWGSGTVRLPPASRVFFLPQPPYLPMGSLRTALAYPNPQARYSDEDMLRVLDRVKLRRLGPELGTVKRWDKELGLDEQRRLVIGRVLLHRPQWLIQDESMYELDEESLKVALSIFATELAHTAVLSIGRRHPEGTFYQRILSLHTGHCEMRLPFPSSPGWTRTVEENNA